MQNECCNWDLSGYNIKAMLRNTVVNRYNINLIDYTTIFSESVSRVVIDELFDLDMFIEDGLKFDRTCKRAITHHVIKTVCECILDLQQSVEIPVLCCCKSCINKTELNQYIQDSCLGDFIEGLLVKINQLLGVNHIMHDRDYDQLLVQVARRDGDLLEKFYETTNNKKPRDLVKLKKYVNTHGLRTIEKQFFEEQRFKQVLI
jgi:hypothetical protein